MKIKKTFQGELPENRIVNTKSNSQTDAYSANYLNDKLNKVVVSPVEPITGEDVWIKVSNNILKFDDFAKEVNGITFTMKDQVLLVKGTATAYTQECYMPIHKTLEEDMTLTQYTSGNADGLAVKAEYAYGGTSYYPNLLSVELNKDTYLNQLYFVISEGATIDAEVRFQLERGKGVHDWQPVMEKQVFVKNANGVYEELVKRNLHIGADKPINGEEVWVQKSNNLFPGWNVGQHYGSSNGTLTLGTTSSSSDLIPVDFSENNKYHFSNLPTNTNTYISAFDSKKDYVGRTSSGIKSEYTFYPSRLSSSGAGPGDANDIKYIAISYQGTDVVNNTMLNLGTEALPYEPYTNKKIFIKNNLDKYEEFVHPNLYVGTHEPVNGEDVWVRSSKNLFDINGNVNISGAGGGQTTYNTVSNNILTSKVNTASTHNVGQKFTNLKGKTFTVSAKIISVGTGTDGYTAIYDNNTLVKGLSVQTGETVKLTYTGTTDNIVVGFATASGENAQFTDIQVELGDTATEFEPYVEKKVLIKNDNGVYEDFYAESMFYKNNTIIKQKVNSTQGSWQTIPIELGHKFLVSVIVGSNNCDIKTIPIALIKKYGPSDPLRVTVNGTIITQLAWSNDSIVEYIWTSGYKVEHYTY